MFAPVVDLALTLLLSLVPTVLFLGLCRGLARLRDDELVDRWLATPGSPPNDPATGRRPPWLDDRDDRTDATRAVTPDTPTRDCPACGAANPEYVEFCAECLRAL